MDKEVVIFSPLVGESLIIHGIFVSLQISLTSPTIQSCTAFFLLITFDQKFNVPNGFDFY